MPLSMMKVGEKTCIKKITGKDDIKRHLENLGFIVGEYVTVISELAGNMIINVKNSRIALDKDMVRRIVV